MWKYCLLSKGNCRIFYLPIDPWQCLHDSSAITLTLSCFYLNRKINISYCNVSIIIEVLKIYISLCFLLISYLLQLVCKYIDTHTSFSSRKNWKHEYIPSRRCPWAIHMSFKRLKNYIIQTIIHRVYIFDGDY